MKKSDAIRSVKAAEYAPGRTFLDGGYEYPLKDAIGQILAAPKVLSRGETWRVEYRVAEGSSDFHPEMAKPLTSIPDDQMQYVDKARLALEELATKDGVHADARLIAVRFLENWPQILGEPFLLRSEDGDGCRIKFFGWGEVCARKGSVPGETFVAPVVLGNGISRPTGNNGDEYSNASMDGMPGAVDAGNSGGGKSGVQGDSRDAGFGGPGAGGAGAGTVFVDSRRNWFPWFVALLILIVLLIFLLTRPGCGVVGNETRISGPVGQGPGGSSASEAPDSEGSAESSPHSGTSASPADSLKSDEDGSGSIDSSRPRSSDPDAETDLRDGSGQPESIDDAPSGNSKDRGSVEDAGSGLGAQDDLAPVGPKSSEETPVEPSKSGAGSQTSEPSGSAASQAPKKESSTKPSENGTVPSSGRSDENEEGLPVDESRHQDEVGKAEMGGGNGANQGYAESGAEVAPDLPNDGHETGSTPGPGERIQSKDSSEGSESGSSGGPTADTADGDAHQTQPGGAAPTGQLLDGDNDISEPLQNPMSGKAQGDSVEVDQALVEGGSQRPKRESSGDFGSEPPSDTKGDEDGGSEGIERPAGSTDPEESAGDSGDMADGERAGGGTPQADEITRPINSSSDGDQEQESAASGDSESEPGLPVNDEPVEEDGESPNTLQSAEDANEDSEAVVPRGLSEKKSGKGDSAFEEDLASPDSGGAAQGSSSDPGSSGQQKDNSDLPDNSLNELIEKARVLGGLAPPLEFVWRIEKTSRALEDGANLDDVVGLQPADPRSNKALPVAVDYRLIIRGKDGDDFDAGIVRVRYESE